MLKSSVVVFLILSVVTGNVVRKKGFFTREHPEPTKGPIVNLFQWSYRDIASECSEYLGKQGFSAVQVGPVTENIEVPGHPWTEKYEPISYKLISRAGTEEEFEDMVWECSRNDVKVYVEVVLNHMTKTYPAGTKGYNNSEADTVNFNYPAVPYTKEDFFFPSCDLTDETNIQQVWECEVNGLHKLDITRHHVRCKIAIFLNYLVSLGVAGFSINAAGYMKLFDLVQIYSLLRELNTEVGFGFNLHPFIYQEVIDRGAMFTNTYVAQSNKYVTDFHYGLKLKEFFTGQKSPILNPLRTDGEEELKLKDLKHFSSTIEKNKAIVFLDNHLTHRNLVYKNEEYLSLSKNPKEYRLALAFMLAYNYGKPIITSGYSFTDPNQGPPSYDNGKLKSVETAFPNPCANGWTCEHRDPIISHLVRFSYLARWSRMDYWWDNGGNQIAFGRSRGGFLVINMDNSDLDKVLPTGLEVGHYCDVFTGFYTNEGTCTGTEIIVHTNRTARFTLKAGDKNGALFIYEDSKIPRGYRRNFLMKTWGKQSSTNKLVASEGAAQ